MERLIKSLFAFTTSIQNEYFRCLELYGERNYETVRVHARFDSLRDFIEQTGLIPEYLAYYRELRNLAKKQLEEITMQIQSQPDLSNLPEICYTVTPTGKFAMLRRGESGYYPVNTEAAGSPNLRELADKLNRQFDVSKAQEAAMLNGSMFGWDTPAADPNNYDSNGVPTLLQQASH